MIAFIDRISKFIGTIKSTLFLLIISEEIMKLLLTIVLILSGIIFVGSVLLMSPKGGLGAAIGGVGGNSEYGSKKSAEGKLKKVAIVTSLIFVIIALILPYVN